MDLNCDLGEGEPWPRTRALIDLVTSVNIACGGHAGTLTSMGRCVRYAKEKGKNIGAHPGVSGQMGRGAIDLAPDTFQTILLHQISSLERVIRTEGGRLHHVKLHGSLYHKTESSREFAKAYLDVVEKYFPKLVIFARSGGLVVKMASRRGLRVWGELFADRAYDEKGGLLPRGIPGAVLSEKEALQRLKHWKQTGQMFTFDGKSVRLEGQTICIHSDTPGARAMARAVAKMIR